MISTSLELENAVVLFMVFFPIFSEASQTGLKSMKVIVAREKIHTRRIPTL